MPTTNATATTTTADRLARVDADITDLEQRLAELRVTRRALLSQLFRERQGEGFDKGPAPAVPSVEFPVTDPESDPSPPVRPKGPGKRKE